MGKLEKDAFERWKYYMGYTHNSQYARDLWYQIKEEQNKKWRRDIAQWN